MALAAAFLLFLLAAPSVFATNYPVVWDLTTNYSSWATRPLIAGDTLTFSYSSGSHNVEVVNKNAYDSCSSSNALQTHTGGTNIITLAEGPTYFICGFPTHCTNGMKLQITARASSSTPSSTNTTGSTPAAGSTGAAGLSSVTPLMFGFPLVLFALTS
ncbi:hypothetical protein SOVF_078030 [Spinacia oleracea]|uniref:Basic blue protein n=1 Tax=Spinacia oleracea TaxID=3562 RepID=A0A9R0JSY1_SPIOL|nr:basic blue protein-like [Spinacia oleracea]KNA17649.1 hypothetical protein SOVF_078030 [Spinacia oleracea]